MMPFTRLVITYGALFLGAVGIFMGAVVLLLALQSGKISYSYKSGAETITTTLRRDEDAGGYWKLVGLMGVAPLAGGIAAVWLTRRKLRS